MPADRRPAGHGRRAQEYHSARRLIGVALECTINDQPTEAVTDEVDPLRTQAARELHEALRNVGHGPRHAPVPERVRLHSKVARYSPSQEEPVGPGHEQAVDIDDVVDGRLRAPVPNQRSVAVFTFRPVAFNRAGRDDCNGTHPDPFH